MAASSASVSGKSCFSLRDCSTAWSLTCVLLRWSGRCTGLTCLVSSFCLAPELLALLLRKVEKGDSCQQHAPAPTGHHLLSEKVAK
jgi:hypothetical protein